MRLTGPKLGLNLRTTGAAHVTLYRTWRPIDLFTGPHGRSNYDVFTHEFHVTYNYGHPIFLLCGFFLSSSIFFPRLIPAVAEWMSTILPHIMWP